MHAAHARSILPRQDAFCHCKMHSAQAGRLGRPALLRQNASRLDRMHVILMKNVNIPCFYIKHVVCFKEADLEKGFFPNCKGGKLKTNNIWYKHTYCAYVVAYLIYFTRYSIFIYCKSYCLLPIAYCLGLAFSSAHVLAASAGTGTGSVSSGGGASGGGSSAGIKWSRLSSDASACVTLANNVSCAHTCDNPSNNIRPCP